MEQHLDSTDTRPADGERRAAIGYWHQYLVGAALILEALENGSLDWVRVADPDDRRAQRIRLTEKGRNLHDPIMKAVDSTFSQVFSGVEEESMSHLKNTLRLVLSNSSKTGEQRA